MKRASCLLLFVIATAAHAAPVPLGQYARWGAFRAERPARCYAIAQPADGRRGQALAIVLAPGGAPRVRLITERLLTETHLRIGGRDFALPESPNDDGRIIAAIRQADTASVAGRDASGRRVRTTYLLAGAPSAIDAAILACLGR